MQVSYNIFKNRTYILLVIAIFILTSTIITALVNLPYLVTIVFSPYITSSTKIDLIVHAPYDYFAGLPFRLISLGLISLLFSINITYSIYYVRLYKAAFVSISSIISTGGILSGLIGIGCISCGSLITAILSSFLSASSIFAVLLLYQEIWLNMISIALLIFSLFLILRKLSLAR